MAHLINALLAMHFLPFSSFLLFEIIIMVKVQVEQA